MQRIFKNLAKIIAALALLGGIFYFIMQPPRLNSKQGPYAFNSSLQRMKQALKPNPKKLAKFEEAAEFFELGSPGSIILAQFGGLSAEELIERWENANEQTRQAVAPKALAPPSNEYALLERY